MQNESTAEQGRTSMREALDDYYHLKEMGEAGDAEEKVREQPALVSRYYDVVTQFYEYAWGQSCDMSPRRKGDNQRASQDRQEQDVGSLLRLKPGMRVADIGCGVGGPLVTIGRSTGASIVGLNFNAHQIARPRQLRFFAVLFDHDNGVPYPVLLYPFVRESHNFLAKTSRKLSALNDPVFRFIHKSHYKYDITY